jgi:GT2 family glycosyltransferase
VIPTRNTRELTGRCLESVARAATLRAPEIIVVDDGSTDGTADAVISAWPETTIVRHAAARGFSAAANAGLELASGSVRLLLNSDTEVDATALDALLETLSRESHLGVVGAQLRYPDGRPQWSGGAEPGLAWLFAQAARLHVSIARAPGYRAAKPLNAPRTREVDWVTGAAMAFRREVWDQVGPLDEGFRLYAQDLDFCLRARTAGWRIAIVPAFSVMHRHGATIEGLEGAADRENTALLWRDLLYWAQKHRGDRYARRARRAIVAGARLRLAVRQVVRPPAAHQDRIAWDAGTNALRSALASLYAEESLGPKSE